MRIPEGLTEADMRWLRGLERRRQKALREIERFLLATRQMEKIDPAVGEPYRVAAEKVWQAYTKNFPNQRRGYYLERSTLRLAREIKRQEEKDKQ